MIRPPFRGALAWLLERLRPRSRRPIDVLVLKTTTCPLCDKAVAVLERHQRRLGLALRVEVIDERPELLEQHRYEVPVVFIEGRKRFIGRVDPVLLEREVVGIRRRPAS